MGRLIRFWCVCKSIVLTIPLSEKYRKHQWLRHNDVVFDPSVPVARFMVSVYRIGTLSKYDIYSALGLRSRHRLDRWLSRTLLNAIALTTLAHGP